MLLLVVACGGRASTSTPSNRTEAAPDAAVSTSCYPYAMRDGTCLAKCDWSSPHAEQGCAKSEWPLICNRDGTCTPEMRFDQ
jgi:hypothetical protein